MIEIIEKLCPVCLEPRPLGHFRKRHRECKSCSTERERKRVAALPEGGKAWNRERYLKERPRALERVKAARLAIRNEILTHYGGHCVCCGEENFKFLSLDHIDQNGAWHRKETGTPGGAQFYYWVKRNGFPSFLRVLCYNCNLATYRNGGICPHEEVRLKLAA